MHNRSSLFALTVIASLATVPADAQTLLLPATPEKGISVETSYTDFEDSELASIDFPSTVTYLAGRFPLQGGVNAVVDLPFSYARVSALGESETSSVFGNPYVGVDYAAARQVGLQLGVRLPLTNSDEESFADVLAFVSDPIRAEAFLKDYLPVSASATVTRDLSDAVTLRARGGATALFYTGDDDSEDFGDEQTLEYGLSSTYTTGPTRLSLGFQGRWAGSADEGSFGDNSIHQLGGAADILVRGVRPGVSIRLPLDSDIREEVGPSFGVYLQVPLR